MRLTIGHAPDLADPAGCLLSAADLVTSTSSQASSLASRSTDALIAQSWLPSGSSMTWRTSQTRPRSVTSKKVGPRASGPAPSTSCSSQ